MFKDVNVLLVLLSQAHSSCIKITNVKSTAKFQSQRFLNGLITSCVNLLM